MQKEQIIQIAENFGWTDLVPQKNPWMISFTYKDTGTRCNVYYTTGTVSIQKKDGTFKYYYNTDTEEKYEPIFLNI